MSSSTDIDLSAFGVNAPANDCPGAGAPDLAHRCQNRPLLLSASGSGTTGTVHGMLTSCVTSGLNWTRVQFFASSSCGASGHGPGETLIGEYFVPIAGSAGSQGTVAFNAPLESPFLNLPGRHLTATATSWDGNTSEFSACVPIEPVSDLIFRNDFELP